MRISVIDTLYSRPNDGPAGESYSIDSSADIIVQKVDGSYEPDRIAFHNFVKRGSEERKPHSCACGLVFYNVNGEAFDSFECGVEVNGYDNAAIASGTAKIEYLMFDVPADEYPVTIYQAYKQGLGLGDYKVPTPLAVKTVPVVPEPKSSTRYYLQLNTRTIKKTGSNTYAPSALTYERYKQVGDSTPEKTTDTTVRIRHYNGRSLSDISAMSDGYPFMPSSTTQYWVLDLYLNGKVIQTEYVHIIKDGDTIQGTNAKMPYPAGEYDANTKYEATAYTTPYVVKKGQYYVLLSNESQNIDPEADYAATGGHWQLMEKYKAVWIEMMFANLGKLGSAIFYGQYMFSQYGKKGDVEITDPDQYGIPVQAGEEGEIFDPNLLINFLTGELKCNNADIRGNIEATRGKFGNLKIVGDRFEGDNGYLHFGPNTGNYTYISTSTTEINRNANIYVSNDTGNYGIYVTAKNTCMKLSGATSISADGAFRFLYGQGAKRCGIESSDGILKFRAGPILFTFQGTSAGKFAINAYKEEADGSLTPIKTIASG